MYASRGTNSLPRKGRCSVCNVYKPLTSSGLLRFHRHLEKTCNGSMQAPRTPAPKPSASSRARFPNTALRRAVLERDRCRCRKCGFYSPTGESLELHHVVGYAQGGLTVADNLHTLCGMCHAELSWLWGNDPPKGYDHWLNVVPATVLIRILLALSGESEMPFGSRDHLEREVGVSAESARRLLMRDRG